MVLITGFLLSFREGKNKNPVLQPTRAPESLLFTILSCTYNKIIANDLILVCVWVRKTDISSNLTHFSFSNLTLHENYNTFKEACTFLRNSDQAKVEQSPDYTTKMSTEI